MGSPMKRSHQYRVWPSARSRAASIAPGTGADVLDPDGARDASHDPISLQDLTSADV